MAVMSYETGIGPNDLLDAPPGVFLAMVRYRDELLRETQKQRRRR